MKEFATKMGTDFALDMLNTSIKMPLWYFYNIYIVSINQIYKDFI